MTAKVFEDESGRVWQITKRGSHFTAQVAQGQRRPREKLHDIARSCARNVRITHTRTGAPLEYVNEHIRIWNTIWDTGTPSY